MVKEKNHNFSLIVAVHFNLTFYYFLELTSYNVEIINQTTDKTKMRIDKFQADANALEFLDVKPFPVIIDRYEDNFSLQDIILKVI